MFDVELVTTNKSAACGPACLKMLLGYYDTDADLDALIEACGVTVNGCSAKTLRDVGRAQGLDELTVWQEEPADVLKQDRPAIIWWQYNHYIVFCGLNDAGDVVICNPMRGKFAIDPESFTLMCTGLEAGTCVAIANGQPQDLPEQA